VPLSEDEQRILEEIERHLHQEDPSFARQVRRTAPRWSSGERAKVGALVFVGGLAVLIAFFFSGILVIGVLAFGAMVGGIVLVAGALPGLGSSGQVHRQRMARAIEDFHQRLRRRYKRG
jgi:Flp pilus assembly protein TadB